MPIRIRWISKEHFGIAMLLLGICGLFQSFFIFIAQYLLFIGNYFVVIFIPVGVTIALFFSTIIIFESYAQVERREKLRSQFQKPKRKRSKLKRFLAFPITKPLLITCIVFIAMFFSSYFICVLFLTNALAFLTAENFSAIICLLIANLIEKKYARVKKY
ncbi:MAG: hypothetical protein ACFE9T_01720 [Promethearchaeota archaeon]